MGKITIEIDNEKIETIALEHILEKIKSSIDEYIRIQSDFILGMVSNTST